MKAIIILMVLLGLLSYGLIVATATPSDKEQYEAYMKWKERRMSKHICAECMHSYFMLYRDGMKCMNEKSEHYAEDIASGDTCEEWEDRRADNERHD